MVRLSLLSAFQELGKNFKSGVNINLSPDHIANPSLRLCSKRGLNKALLGFNV